MSNETRGADGWTSAERADLAAAAPELTGTTRDELRILMARYGKTDERLRALLSGRITTGAAAAAVQEAEEAKAVEHYARLRRSSADLERNRG